MASASKHLNYHQQLLLLKRRGLQGLAFEDDSHYNDQIRSIRNIGYYKLKQYMYCFWNQENNCYQNISYDQIITRYYRDQRLKQFLFQAICDIEASLNTRISYVLGQSGPLMYTNFYSWCQTSGYNRFIKGKTYLDNNRRRCNVNKFTIKKDELSFLSRIQANIEHSYIRDIRSFEQTDSKVFPSIWLTVNVLTFGQSIYLLRLMSKRNKTAIANSYHTSINNLIKWLQMLNLVRNLCCHNGDLVDISFRTMPSIPKKYNQYLNIINGNVPHRIGSAICIILHLLREINPKYNVLKTIKPPLINLCMVNKELKEISAKNMGFKNIKAIENLSKSFYTEPNCIYYPDQTYINL